MALQIVWRNPRPQFRKAGNPGIENLDCGMSLCIVRTADSEIIFQIGKDRSLRKVLEVTRVGGL